MMRKALVAGGLVMALAGGATIGVIASGIDVTYPPEHAELQQRVEGCEGLRGFAAHM